MQKKLFRTPETTLNLMNHVTLCRWNHMNVRVLDVINYEHANDQTGLDNITIEV